MKIRFGDKRDLKAIRELLFEGKYVEAEKLASQKLMAERLPTGTRAYQTLGDLHIHYSDSSNYTSYRRSLQLDAALVKVQYTKGGTDFNREVFSSAVDDMIVFRETAEGDGRINCQVSLSRPGEGEEILIQDNSIIMKQHVENGQGVRYESRISIMNSGGAISVNDDGIIVTDANSIEIRIVAATDYLKALPDLIAKWLPKPLASLGTDGFGRSESREALRDFFEVDAKHIVFATLGELAKEGKIKNATLDKAKKELGINPEKLNPLYS